MIRILAIHDSDLTNGEYKNKLITRYPILGEFPNIWKVDVIKLGKKLTKLQRSRKYDSLYYDTLTCKLNSVLSYVTAIGQPRLIPIDFNKPLKTKKDKNITLVQSKIKKLTTNNKMNSKISNR